MVMTTARTESEVANTRINQHQTLRVHSCSNRSNLELLKIQRTHVLGLMIHRNDHSARTAGPKFAHEKEKITVFHQKPENLTHASYHLWKSKSAQHFLGVLKRETLWVILSQRHRPRLWLLARCRISLRLTARTDPHYSFIPIGLIDPHFVLISMALTDPNFVLILMALMDQNFVLILMALIDPNFVLISMALMDPNFVLISMALTDQHCVQLTACTDPKKEQRLRSRQ